MDVCITCRWHAHTISELEVAGQHTYGVGKFKIEPTSGANCFLPTYWQCQSLFLRLRTLVSGNYFSFQFEHMWECDKWNADIEYLKGNKKLIFPLVAFWLVDWRWRWPQQRYLIDVCPYAAVLEDAKLYKKCTYSYIHHKHTYPFINHSPVWLFASTPSGLSLYWLLDRCDLKFIIWQ